MPIAVHCAELRGVAVPLRELVRRTLALEGRAPGEIAVVLADDETLRTLNRRWRGIDRATDVLSFGYDASPPGGRDVGGRGRPAPRPGDARGGAGRSAARRPRAVNGDLVISLDRMREQARRFRVSAGEELARLVIHGALHLTGLDHHRAAERRHMRAREAVALRAGAVHIRALARALTRAYGRETAKGQTR